MAGEPTPTSEQVIAFRSGFEWIPKKWKSFKAIAERSKGRSVTLMVHTTHRNVCAVKKVVIAGEGEGREALPIEIRVLLKLPNCNRIVHPYFYTSKDPRPTLDTIIFAYYPLGDLINWKKEKFDKKNNKAVPESFIWRFFLQISQALSVMQNVSFKQDGRKCYIHRDIKPQNILVVDNGTTYPSFKLHDFDCATTWRASGELRKSYCGTFIWQPPENPLINTTAADIWSLGACVHFLAVGQPPTGDVKDWVDEEGLHNLDEAVWDEYGSVDKYYEARVPREVTEINLDEEYQEIHGMYPIHPEYSDELNEWMSDCLATNPKKRPSPSELEVSMGAVARDMLRQMGGRAAIADLDVKCGPDIW